MRLGVFNNILAGGGGTHASDVIAFLGGRSDIAHVETDFSGVREGLAELAAREVDVLVVNGGDGTLQRVLTEIHRHRVFARAPMIAPLRSGRTNMNALDIGSRRNPVKALVTLMAAAADGSLARRIVERPVMRIDLGDDAGPQYGMFCGFGTVHRAIELTHRVFPKGRAQGVFGAGIVTGLLMTRAALGSARDVLTPDAIDIRLEGEPVHEREFKLVIATTLDRFFLGMRPFWGTEPAPIRFTALSRDAMRFATSVDVIRGRRPRAADRNGFCVSRNVHSSELRLDCGVTIDGEMHAPRPGRDIRIDAEHSISFVRSD